MRCAGRLGSSRTLEENRNERAAHEARALKAGRRVLFDRIKSESVSHAIVSRERSDKSVLFQLVEGGSRGFVESFSEKRVEETVYGFLAPNYSPFSLTLVKAQGVWVWDANGKKYLDMIGCYSAAALGHSPKEVIDVMEAQAREWIVSPSRAVLTREIAAFSRVLAAFTGMDMAIQMNSGAEANETALKAAKRWGYKVKGVEADKAEVISAKWAFHGRTLAVLSLMDEECYRDGFGPFVPGSKMIPFGDAEALEKAITPNTVAFLVEPIQAEGGIIIPPPGYFEKVREICERHNVLLIMDEVQTGFARTGKPFAFMWEGVTPDLMTVGKALGANVYPVSAVVGRRDVLKQLSPGTHGSTFGGNPLACVIGLESIRQMILQKLSQRAQELGSFFAGELRKIQAASSGLIRDVRGRGLLIGVEVNAQECKKRFGSGFNEEHSAHEVADRIIEEGVLTKDTRHDTLRFAPPLTVKRGEIEWALERIAKVLR